MATNPQQERDNTGSQSLRRTLWAAWAVLLCLGFLARLSAGYDADELQHFHFAWNIGQGMLPYRDFFEHHPPLLHYVLAPMVRSLTEANFALLLVSRLAALGILVWIITEFCRLLRLSVSKEAAWWGAWALLITHPIGTAGFEFRADWIALACLVRIATMLAQSVRSSGKRAFLQALGAGLLGGIGVCLTQKTGFLLLAILVWLAAAVLFAPDSAARKQRLLIGLLFIAGMLAPIALLALWFMAHGAGQALLQHVVVINLHWVSEGTWKYTVQQALLPTFGLFALGMLGALRAFRGSKQKLAEGSPETLVAIILIFGIIALLRTPVPHGQSFLFLIVPWAMHLATITIYESVTDRPHARSDFALLAAAVGICLATLYWYNAVIVAVVWLPLGYGLWRYASRGASDLSRLNRAFAVMAVIGGLVYIGRVGDALRHKEGRTQAEIIRLVSQKLEPGEPVLETWPLLTPFHPQPTFHGFARAGIIETVTPAVLEPEYIGALEQGKCRVAIISIKDIKRQLPSFAGYLNHRMVALPKVPSSNEQIGIYVMPDHDPMPRGETVR
jgi:hypothetical protein